MHQSAFDWVSKMTRMLPVRRSVLEFGARDVNGTVRSLFHHADIYIGVDCVAGETVDVVSPAESFSSHDRFDTVVCMEVLEHTDKGREICRNAYRHLVKGGIVLVTAAGVGRPAHSAVDGGELKEGEYYRNVTVAELRFWLSDFSLVMVDTDTAGDVYALAIR